MSVASCLREPEEQGEAGREMLFNMAAVANKKAGRQMDVQTDRTGRQA